MKILRTDYYQLTMVAAYIMLDQANEQTGFEAFVRQINPDISKDNYYIFDGGDIVYSFINRVKDELTHQMETLKDEFIGIISPVFADVIKLKWGQLNRNFDFAVYPHGRRFTSMTPVFQYNGPKWIGQLIETQVLNCLNSSIGKATIEYFSPNKKVILDINDPDTYTYCLDLLRKRAKEYRNSTKKVIVEAGFRRAINQQLAVDASVIAIEEGWNLTSNIGAYFDNKIPLNKLTGTMSHSFIMSQMSEAEAFKLWLGLYKKSTLLIDTYNVENAINSIIENRLSPAFVRIDSDPLPDLCLKVREMLDKNNLSDTLIIISGDLTPEGIETMEDNKIPFDVCLVGNKYVNTDILGSYNSGLVYKLVQCDKGNGNLLLPKKNSKNKESIPGLKIVEIFSNDSIHIIHKRESFGYIIH